MKNYICQGKASILSVFMVLICPFILIGNNSYSQSIKNFTGKWVLNESKSSPSSAVPDSKLIITEENGITLNIKTVTADNNSVTQIARYLLLGEGTGGVSNRSPTREQSLVCKWGTYKNSFTVTETITDCDNGIKKKKVFEKITVFSLTDNGKTLIIKADETLPKESTKPENERHYIKVYNKL